MRDVLRALATIGSLSSAQVSDAGFQDLVQDTRISLSERSTAMAQDAGVLGNVQSSLTATQSRLADTQTALTGQVSSAEDVDMAATLSQLSLVQTQMQASYQLIATLSGLSLVEVPAGRMMKIRRASSAVNSGGVSMASCPQKAGHAVTLWKR